MKSAEKKVFSQFNEDGILLWLFDRLGSGDKRFVEFGIQNGKECNAAHLIINHAWSGLLMEGNPADAERAAQYYAAQPTVRPGQVTVKPAFVTSENINALLADHASLGPTDLLSLDIDGVDLWVWKAIRAIDPRVVVIEYNAAFGPERSVSVINDPAFERFKYHATGLYHGASLSAFEKVGREKGYVLVGCESHGVNAFFVKADEAAKAGLVALTPGQAFYEHAWRAARFGAIEKQFELIKDLELVEI